MKEFIAENWFVLILGIIFLAAVIYLAITKAVGRSQRVT
jgi:cbb3-type cytochrome oxidase subunit 3